MAVLSAKEVAIELGTDARTLRKFLRDITPKDEQPGQGKRWAFEKKQVKALKKKFDTWTTEHAAPKPKVVEEEVDDDTEVEEIEDDEEVEEIDDDLEDEDEEDLEEI